MDNSQSLACAWCLRPVDDADKPNAYGLCRECQQQFGEILGVVSNRRRPEPLSLNHAFQVVHELSPASFVESFRCAVAEHSGLGHGLEAEAVWDACIGAYRSAGRPYGISDAGFGRWLFDQEQGTFAAAGAARLAAGYILGHRSCDRGR